MRSDRSIREDLQRPLKLLLPPILRLEDVEACLVATQPDEEDIVVVRKCSLPSKEAAY